VSRNGTVIRKFLLHVSKAEQKRRLAVAAAIIDAVAGLDLAYPTAGPAQRRQLAAARRELSRGGG
jgi:hypothetical protein